MPLARKSQYRRAARLYYSGKYSQAKACHEAGVYAELESAQTNAYKLFKPDTGNKWLLEELERLQKIEFDETILSKKEKLEANARLSRGIIEKLDKQLEDEDGEIDHKLLDSYVKVGKRDDVLQGHQISAETNPQDKKDAILADWFMEAQRQNEEKRGMKNADVVDI